MKKTKIKESKELNLAEQLSQIPVQEINPDTATIESISSSPGQICLEKPTTDQPIEPSGIPDTSNENLTTQSADDLEIRSKAAYDALFERWDEREFSPQDFMIDVPIDSFESRVGYSSLLRQMHQSFIRMVAFHKSEGGGKLSSEEARKRAFHACTNKEEAKNRFHDLMRLPLQSLNFIDLDELYQFAPRVAERFWERAKREGCDEFESGHLAANITFPVGYMKEVWNIARYLGVRESFINDWCPKGGIEVALIDMLAQSYFQWQFWLEQTVKRSQTEERSEHPAYTDWKRRRKADNQAEGWEEGHWLRPYVSEQQAIEQAVQMADRWNRIFMRTLRQLRDFRRYSPVTINNPSQVNIAADGGQQINVSKIQENN
jgi:hypothetical protein